MKRLVLLTLVAVGCTVQVACSRRHLAHVGAAKRRRRAVWLIVTAAGLIAASASTAAAQNFGLRRGMGTLEFRAEGAGLAREGGADLGSDLLLLESLKLPFAGWILDPRILRFTFSVSPRFQQRHVEAVEDAGGSSAGAYDLSGHLFSTRRLSASFRASRTSSESRGSYDVRSENRGSAFMASMRFRDAYFPVQAVWERRQAVGLWESPVMFEPLVTDRRTGRAAVTVTNPKLTASVERYFIEDAAASRDDARTTARFRHQLAWGKGSSLISNLRFEGRSGARESSISQISERMRIKHTTNASSSLQYVRQKLKGASSSLSVNILGLSTSIAPAKWISTGLVLSRRTVGNDGLGRTVTNQITPSASVEGRLPWGLTGDVDVTFGLQDLSRSGFTDETWVDAVAEEHAVDEFRTFRLDHAGADVATVELWLIPEGLRLQENVDYWIQDLGSQVEVRILPGGRVEIGAVVTASYRYRAMGSTSGRTTFLNLRGSLHHRFANLSIGQREQSGDPFDASGGVDQSSSSDSWLSLSIDPPDTPLGRFRFSWEHSSRRWRGLSTVSDAFNVNLQLPFRGRVTASAQGSMGRSADGTSVTRNASLSGEARWRAGRRLTLRGGISAYRWSRQEKSADRFLSTNVAMQWGWGRFDTTASYVYSLRANGSRIRSSHWNLLIKRTF